MAKLAPKILRFVESPTEDVVGYRIRYIPDGDLFSYDDAYDEIAPPGPEGDGYSRVDLSTLPQAQDLDGVFDVYVTAIDDNQPSPNESDPLAIPDAVFDFRAPEAPTDGAVES